MPVIPLISNPNRPPKKWWKDCTEGVKKSRKRARHSKRAMSPESVCGSLWFHKMSGTARKKATKRYERNSSMRWYVGQPLGGGRYEMFQSDINPTEITHGAIFSFAIGPFRTRLGARIMGRHGKNNPHLQSVADAERYAAKGKQWLLDNGFDV